MTAIGELLWIERPEGAAVPHRVIPRSGVALASYDGRRQRCRIVGFIDTLRSAAAVPAADLVPAAPLSDKEEAEYCRLDARLAGTQGDARLLRRFNALRLRSVLFPARVPA